MTLLILLYLFSSNGLTVAAWCWIFAWVVFILKLLGVISKMITDNIII